jgi:hypothetical protein
LTADRENVRRTLTDELERTRKQMHEDHEASRVDLQTRMEQQRREKDQRHAELEDQFEAHRVQMNQIITTHESTI